MSDAPQEQAGNPDAPQSGAAPAQGSVIDKSRRRTLLIGVAIVVLLLGLAYLLYDVFIGSRSVTTDNAYVAGENAQVTPLTSGQVVEVAVIDTQPVRRGQMLMQLDDQDQRLAVQQAEASLAMAQRRFTQSRAQGSAAGASAQAKQAAVPDAQARLTAARADLDRARAEYQRRAALDGSGAVSAEDMSRARNALAAAQATVQQAQAGLVQARADVVSARQEQTAATAITAGLAMDAAPEVREAAARLAQARLDLARTVIRSPVDGVIAQRTVQVGQRVTNATVAMVVVPVEQLYVDANFKEDQLGKVRSGQSVELVSDFYGDDVVYRGKVIGFSGGTGSAFALVPAQNATGNWIKVVQRLPVRVALDAAQLRAHPLRVGLSMEATIYLTSRR